MRIHVTGNAGAGKTTLATRIGAELNLPVYGLDRVVWQPGWQKTPPDLRDRLESELISGEDWVIEGVSHRIRRAADITIFLDVPRHRCFGRALLRSFRHLLKGRSELPDNCPEYLIIHRLIPIIWGFHRRIRRQILEDSVEGARFIHLADPVEFSADLLEREQSQSLA